MQNKNINTIIRERRSVFPRNFQENAIIEDRIIEEILENAIWAPTHKLTQPWHFKVFHNTGVKKFFEMQAKIYQEITPADKVNKQKLKKYEDKVLQVSHVIAIVAQHDNNERIPAIEEVVATSCALQNIYLSLEAYGIAGYLSTGDVCYTPQMADFLNLNEGDKILGFFQLGIPKEGIKKHNRKRQSLVEKTIWLE